VRICARTSLRAIFCFLFLCFFFCRRRRQKSFARTPFRPPPHGAPTCFYSFFEHAGDDFPCSFIVVCLGRCISFEFVDGSTPLSARRRLALLHCPSCRQFLPEQLASLARHFDLFGFFFCFFLIFFVLFPRFRPYTCLLLALSPTVSPRPSDRSTGKESP